MYPALTGSESVKSKRPVLDDKGGNRWHLWDCKVFSCKSESGAVRYQLEVPRLTSRR